VLMTLLQQNEKVSRIARLQACLDGGCDWPPDTENSGFWFVRTPDDANATEVPSATMSFVVEAFRRGKPTVLTTAKSVSNQGRRLRVGFASGRYQRDRRIVK